MQSQRINGQVWKVMVSLSFEAHYIIIINNSIMSRACTCFEDVDRKFNLVFDQIHNLKSDLNSQTSILRFEVNALRRDFNDLKSEVNQRFEKLDKDINNVLDILLKGKFRDITTEPTSFVIPPGLLSQPQKLLPLQTSQGTYLAGVQGRTQTITYLPASLGTTPQKPHQQVVRTLMEYPITRPPQLFPQLPPVVKATAPNQISHLPTGIHKSERVSLPQVQPFKLQYITSMPPLYSERQNKLPAVGFHGRDIRKPN